MNEEDWIVLPGHGMGPFEFDLDRETIIERIEAAELKYDLDEADPSVIEFIDEEVILVLSEDAPHRLLQIDVLDDRVRIEDQAVIGRRPHELVDAWGLTDSETLWTVDPAINDPLSKTAEETAGSVNDQKLLTNGTLWIPAKRVGLKLYHGEIEELLLRSVELVPSRGVGSLTAEQRELLGRRDLTEALQPPPSPGSRLAGTLQRLLTLAALITGGIIFWQGMQFQQRWNNSTEVEGTVTAVNPPPPAAFPDELTVEYQDKTGKTHQVVWKRADVYVTREVGEKVAVHYLDEAPDKPMGPARVRDAAFLIYMPYGIGVMAAYVVLMVLVGLLGKLVPVPEAEE
jgi:hypothetical protein